LFALSLPVADAVVEDCKPWKTAQTHELALALDSTRLRPGTVLRA
jgi:hypothetical protein